MDTARLFQSGRSQAVRLPPKAIRLRKRYLDPHERKRESRKATT